jgi:murein DD-endopeptidase MepM/ murein hydrolase activator NlpD
MRAAPLLSLLLPVFSLMGQSLTGQSLMGSPVQAQEPTTVCLKPVLDRLASHRVTSSETLASIAQRYDISTRTLSHFNPGGEPRSGQTLRIPPFNGSAVAVSPGQSWKDIASRYGVRADLLFELNGCTPKSAATIFVPSNVVASASSNSNSNSNPVRSVPASTAPIATGPKPPAAAEILGLQPTDLKELPHYPLAQRSTIVLGYGQYSPKGESPNGANSSVFHGGVDLSAGVGDRVFAAGAGTIAFAGDQGSYGAIVVINHRNGIQTRYAQLSKLAVKQGQKVEAGAPIGNVGQSGSPSSAVPHLHYEIRLNAKQGWVAQDPTPYFANKLAIGQKP